MEGRPRASSQRERPPRAGSLREPVTIRGRRASTQQGRPPRANQPREPAAVSAREVAATRGRREKPAASSTGGKTAAPRTGRQPHRGRRGRYGIHIGVERTGRQPDQRGASEGTHSPADQGGGGEGGRRESREERKRASCWRERQRWHRRCLFPASRRSDAVSVASPLVRDRLSPPQRPRPFASRWPGGGGSRVGG